MKGIERQYRQEHILDLVPLAENLQELSNEEIAIENIDETYEIETNMFT